MSLVQVIFSIVLLAVGAQGNAGTAVFENPCDRYFPTAASLEISDGQEGCVESCSLQAYRYAILYMGRHCFCNDTFDGMSTVVPANFSGSPPWPCDTSNSYASVYNTGQLPTINISAITVTSDPLLVTLSYSFMGDESSYVVELETSDSMPVAGFPPQQIFLNQTPTSPITLRTLARVELDVYVYENGSLDRPNSFSSLSLPDCQLSSHCTRDSVIIAERSLDVQNVSIECPSIVLSNDWFECTISVIARDFNISIDFTDKQTGLRAALGSSELVLGVMESEKYHNLSLATYGSTQLGTSYLIFHRTFNEPGVVHSIEYTVADGGSFYLMVYTPSCSDGEIYCHKLKQCSPTQQNCDSASANNTACLGAKVYSLSRRMCVEDGVPAINVQTPGPFAYSLTDSVLITDSLGSEGTVGKSLIHRLDPSQYLQVSAGSILGVLSTSGALTTVSFASVQKQNTRVLSGLSSPAEKTASGLADYSDSGDEPVVTAHVWRKSVYAVDHVFPEGCQTHDVKLEVTTSSSTATASQSVRVVDALSGVSIHGPPTYGNSSEGHLVVKTNEATVFSIPEHLAYCDTDYLFDWGDSVTQNVSGTSASYTYITPGIYDIVVMGYTPLSHSNASRTILAQDAIEGLNLTGVATVTEFGQVTTFTVVFTAGTNVTLTFDTGDGHIHVESLTGHSVGVSYNYSKPGYYVGNVTLANDVSSQWMPLIMPVEVPISGLNISYGYIFYDEKETTDMRIKMDTGTRVNFTCIVDGSRDCSNWWMSWENQTGVIAFGIDDYLTTGYHNLTITAVNLITPNILVITKHLDIYYSLNVENVTTPNTTVVAPGDNVYIVVNINTGSLVHINVSCGNGLTVNEAYEYLDRAVDATSVLPLSFSDDGVYTCLVNITSPSSNHPQSLTFTVQYPITGVILARINASQKTDDDTILRPPDYSEMLQFALLRPTGSHLPTNCSWSVQFDDMQANNSTEYLSERDEGEHHVNGYQHMISFNHAYTKGGRYLLRVILWNEITPDWSDSYEHVIHEEISGVSIQSVVHIANGVTRPGHPNKYSPKDGESYTNNVYEFDSNLQFTGDIARGTNVTWMWNFGDSSIYPSCDCPMVTHNYTSASHGTYNITLNVSNGIKPQLVHHFIELEKRVENVLLSSDFNTVILGEKTKWKLDFGHFSTDACYYLDFVADAFTFGNTKLCNDLVIKSGKTPRAQTIESNVSQVVEAGPDIFPEVGIYNVTFVGVNRVSSSSSTKVVGVTKTYCGFPKIEMHEYDCTDHEICNATVKAAYKSKEIIVKAKVKLDCEGKDVSHTWTVYKVIGGKKEVIDGMPNGTLTSIRIPKRELEYGLYEIELTVRMVDEVGIESKNSSRLHVVATPLVAALTTGPLRVVQYNENFILDAATNSYDPDEGDSPVNTTGLRFIWLCRLDCEVTSSIVEDETSCDDYYKEGKGTRGCFYNDHFNQSGRFTDNDTDGQLTIQTKDATYEDVTLHFEVHVQKGSRSVRLYSNVKIATNVPPQIQIHCGVNCVGKTNLDQKWTFRTEITDSNGVVKQQNLTTTYNYEWDLYNSTGNPLSWEHAQSHPIDQAWHSFLANTGHDSPSLVFKPNSQINASSIFVAVKVWEGNDDSNYGSQIFPVTFNNAPIVNDSACELTPSNGTAKNTTFHLTCAESAFVDDDEPLSYELHIQPSKDFPSFLYLGPVSQLSELTGFQLPFGLEKFGFNVTLKVEAIDKYMSSSSLELSAKVMPMNKKTSVLFEESLNNLDNGINDLLSSGDPEKAVVELNILGNLINNYDQTADEIRCKWHVCPPGSSAEDDDDPATDISAEQIRNKAISMIVENLEQHTVDDAIRVATTLETFTQVASEVSKASLEGTQKKLASSVAILLTSKDLGLTKTIDSVKALLGALGNTFEANKVTEKKQYEMEERGKRDTTVQREENGAEASLDILNSVGEVLGGTLVSGEAPEVITTNKLNVSASKRTVEEIGLLDASGGASITLSNDVINSDNPNAVMSMLLSSMRNPFYSVTTANFTDSETLRLVIRSESNQVVDLGNNPQQPHILYLPTPAAKTRAAIIDVAGFGDISVPVKLNVAPKMSLSLFFGVFVAPTDFNLTAYASNHTNNTGSGNATIDTNNINLTVYLKKWTRVTKNNYDYKCELPSQEANRSAFTTYNGLPQGINGSQLMPFTCFVSDKELALQNTTNIYVAVEYTHLAQNSTRRRRDADPMLDPNTAVYYNMTPITSQCKFFDPNLNDWNTDGCEVGPLTTTGRTQCVCIKISVEEEVSPTLSITTSAYYEPKSKYNPFGGISFGASFEPPFNTFDPHDPNLWKNLSEDPLIFSVMVSLVCFYLCCLIWARRWDLKDEVKAGASPLLDNDPSDSYLYELTVFTGSKRAAGTTAKVSMIFAGFEEETPPRLIYDDKRPVLQTGGVDSFLMAVPRPLGPLNHIRVWHDNSGASPGWQFAYMCVVDLLTKDKFFFVCNGWLSVSDGDGVIDRIIPTATRDDLIDFSHLFWTKARKDITDSHIWFSVFGRPAKSVFTRVQRITCCLVLLFTSMNVGILLYNDNSTSSATGQSFSVGPISLTFDEIRIGFYSSMLVFPINLLIVFIFRNCKHRESPRLREAKQKASEYHKIDEPTKSGGKKKKKPFLLPWWFQGVAYFLCLACVAVCFWATVTQGLTFGPEKSKRWLKSFVVSFVESLLLSQPIKVVLFAMFYALVIRSPTIEDELENDPGLLQGEEYLHTHNKAYNAQYLQLQKSLAKYKVLPTPPQPEFIMAAKKKKQKEDQMQALLREILAYIIFVYLLYSMSYGSKHAMTWRMYRNQQNAFEYGLNHQYGPMKNGPGYEFAKPMPMKLVGSMDSFWDWSSQTFLPALYSNLGYAGEKMPKFSTMDGVNYIVGSARFRQIRVKGVRCAAAVYKYEQHCAQSISAASIDRGNYSTHWAELTDGEESADGFTYANASTLHGVGTNGVFGYYEGGGYAHNLGRTQTSAAKHIAYLKSNDWVDEHTRAIFVEFTTFNVQLMLYSVSYIVFEMAPTGAFHPNFAVKLVQPERYQSSNAVMMLISEVGIIIYTIYFLVVEIKLFKKLKWGYFQDFWNCVESITLALLLSSIGMTFYRFYMLVELSKRKQLFKKNDYISYQNVALFEESYLFLLGFIIFLSTGKFLKLLRFNKKMNVLGYTLLYIAKPFLSFMVTMVMVFIAYSHMAYLVFNTVLAEFHTFIRSLFTLFTLMLNKFDYQSMEQANPVFAPIIFSTFTVSMGFMLVSFMLSLIIEGFTTVRADLENQPNKYELVDFVVGKFKSVLGLGAEEMPAMRDKKEDFVEDSQKELDVKFGEFSEKVFGMFLQDPEDIKTMKMADDLISREKKLKQKRKKIVYG